MKTLYFTPNYYFKGRFWIKPLKYLAKRYFMKIRSEWVDLVNPLYERINDSWDIVFPGVKLEGDMLDEYDRYVAEASNHMLLISNGYPGNLLFKGMANPETADFRLVCRFCKSMYVDYDMTPIEGPT